jgi:hypothetical protein
MNARDYLIPFAWLAEIDHGLDHPVLFGERKAIAGRHVEPPGSLLLDCTIYDTRMAHMLDGSLQIRTSTPFASIACRVLAKHVNW